MPPRQTARPALLHRRLRLPRVFVAENGLLLENWTTGLETLASSWPGAFGVDFSGTQGWGTVATLQGQGVTVMNEGFMTDPSNPPDKSLFLVDSNGNISSLYPYHGQDETQPQVLQLAEAVVAAAAKGGFTEFLLIDYAWPYDARFGYGPATLQAFRDDLNGVDDGMFIATSSGGYVVARFWDYLRLYTDIPFQPADVGLTDWNGFVPVSADEGANGTVEQRKNDYLYNALWHYTHDKFLQKLGDYGQSLGIAVFPSLNGESYLNGTDLYAMGKLRGIPKLGYEYFDAPDALDGRSTTKYYEFLMRRSGHDMTLVQEIGPGGHGPTTYTGDAAYANQYDATSAGKPADYNNQYMEVDWSTLTPTDTAEYPRYAYWEAGALGFMQSHSEGASLQPPKGVALVAYRPVLESRDYGDMGDLLRKLHIPFDRGGKEDLDAFANAANVLIYCPSESSPMHAAAVRAWLAASPGRTLVAHSFVPFSMSDGTFMGTLPLMNQGLASLSLAGVDATQTVNLTVNGMTVSSSHDVFRLASPATVLLKSDEGEPLISRVTSGASQVLYIHVDVSAASGPFEQAVALQAMQLAGVTPEANAPTNKGVHIYAVGGGQSAVIWDDDVVASKAAAGYYYTRVATTPTQIAFAAKPSTSFSVYDFYADTVQTVLSASDGNLTYASSASVDIVYYGETDSAAFCHDAGKRQGHAGEAPGVRVARAVERL